ncbi:AAA family ATPase [Paenibacillus sp. FSL R7-0302]|uniref:AAA family ATPase n=1 Tax=Paenibacillus sp. FSL R7-0302 TaxID=2921681 RepID=UPI0030F74D4E
MAINLKQIQVNTPQVALEDYFWLIAGVPKSGKTSLFAKLTEQYFGDTSKSLLLAFEKGYQALRVQAQDVKDWDDMEEIVEQLVDDKEELGIKLIGIDTADIMWEMAQASVIQEWNAKNPQKRTKDIGGVGAKGKSDQGFGAGYNLAKAKIRESLDKLMKAGYGIMVLTHSKDKKVEQKDGLEYDQLNVSLASSAREIFVNMADFIIFITVEKKQVGTNIETKRYMYFRSDGYVEAGSRFKHVPERIEYSIPEFLAAFKHAVEAEFESGVDLEQIKKEQAERREAAAKEFIEQQKSEPTADELIAVLDVKMKAFTKAEKQGLVEVFKEILGGNANYKIVEDVALLQKCVDHLATLE